MEKKRGLELMGMGGGSENQKKRKKKKKKNFRVIEEACN